MKWSKRTMLKSVWLSSLIVSSMNESGSVLAAYYSHLRNLAQAEKSMMILTEPDGSGKTFFMILPEAACMTPAPGIRADERMIAEVMKSKTPRSADTLQREFRSRRADRRAPVRREMPARRGQKDADSPRKSNGIKKVPRM